MHFTIAVSPFIRQSFLTAMDAAAARTAIGAGVGGGDALTTNPLSQFAATTSLQLKGVISDETGSGALVFANTPTLLAPILGNASCTSLTVSGALTVSNTGMKVQDTDASHSLVITPGSNLTADRVLTITTGDAARTLTLSGDLTVSSATTLNGPASDTVAGPIEIATQAEQETGTSTTLAVTPGRQHSHASASKTWAELDGTGVISLRASYNQDAPTDNGTGDYTFNITTDFSSTSYAVVNGNLYDSGSAASHIHSRYNATAKAAGSVRMLSILRGTGAAVDTDEMYIECHGDQ